MKKIPTIFKRNPENMREILDEQHPDCGWVFNGEGTATRKYDGTCVKIENGQYFKRREVKRGRQAPPDFIEEQLDANTGKRVGWVPVDPDSKEDRYHMEAFDPKLQNGTYELVGPKIQGNPEGYDLHTLICHANAQVFPLTQRTFDSLRVWLIDKNIEGLILDKNGYNHSFHSDGKKPPRVAL